jgi:hypothetical protein
MSLKIAEACSLSSKWFSEFLSPGAKTNPSFLNIKAKIDAYYEKAKADGKKTSLLRSGGIIFKNCIKKKLRELLQKTKNKPERKSLQERLAWFNSSHCTSVFVKPLTGNYSEFLTEFFDTGKGVPWRPILEGPGGFTKSDGPKLNMANKQCLATIGDYSTKDKCYICGGRLSEKLFAPECEHLLAIESALCHLWIAKDTKKLEKEDLEVKNFIRKEYKWAHTCCNRTKSNRDLIREINTGYYEVDIDEILSLLENIKTSQAHDCYDLNKRRKLPDGIGRYRYANIEDNKPRLIGIFQELVDIINGNIDEIGTDYYPIYMKYRFLSAIADDHFERIISEGSFGGGKKMIGGTKEQEEFLDNVLTSEELDKEISEDIDEIISEVEQNEEENPNYYEPLYERIQTKIIYDEETGEPDITEISFYPYKEFHAILEKAKKTGSIMPPFLPKKSYYSEDGRVKFSVPIGNNPYGTFGIEEKTVIEPLAKMPGIEEQSFAESQEPSLTKSRKGGSKKRRLNKKKGKTIKKYKNSKRKNRSFKKL